MQARAPWRPGSMSATPGAHGCGGAATARVLALICPPALGGLDGQLWCRACLQATLRCSKTALSSLTSGILERVPFCFLPKSRNPLCWCLFSPGALRHQGGRESPADYTGCSRGLLQERPLVRCGQGPSEVRIRIKDCFGARKGISVIFQFL